MRICIISNPNSIHTQRWLRYFIERGHELYLIAVSTPQGPVLENIQLIDLASKINMRKIRYPFWAHSVRQYVRRIKPDVLHSHQVANAGWLGAIAGFHPFMVSAWGSDLLVGPKRYWSHRILARWVLSKADYVTCVSSSLAQAALSLGVDQDRLEVAPWGVDTDIYHPAPTKKALREKLGLGDGPIVLSLRAIKPIYNPLDIARAIPQTLAKIPKVQFIIRTYNCDQYLLDQFKSIVRENGADHRVKYIGGLDDEKIIADLYRASDIAISIPNSDGTPSSVLEALACGTPLVLSDIPSLHEWVQHENEGLFVPVGDIAAISNAIVRLLTDKMLHDKLSTNGLQLIQQRADSKVWMRHAEELYKRVKISSREH